MPPIYDLVCLSHLRWDFVFQRPQHLLTRFARERRVFYVEEPIVGGDEVRLDCTLRECGVWVAVPHLPDGLSNTETQLALTGLMDELALKHTIHSMVLWFYTPMALPWAGHLTPLATVYDCMDELSAFRNAPVDMQRLEQELFAKADVVFTGGQSLYDAKRHQHPSVRLFPSSVDVQHFARARTPLCEPTDQAGIPGPRIGYYGVIDERMDLDLLAGIAEARPDWQIVMLGPVTKIAPENLPGHANIHYLGPKNYEDLPDYLAGWDVAMLPFARNASTRFISPTKTPEYLAAGKPVVSSSIKDVVRPYGESELVLIADTPDAFVAAVERLLIDDGGARQARADGFLAEMSWDRTSSDMATHIASAIAHAQFHRITTRLFHEQSVPTYQPAVPE